MEEAVTVESKKKKKKKKKNQFTLQCLTLRSQVYLRDGFAQTTVCAATLREKFQIKIFYLTQSQYTETGPTSPSVDPITPGGWQGSYWSASFSLTGMIRPGKQEEYCRQKSGNRTLEYSPVIFSVAGISRNR